MDQLRKKLSDFTETPPSRVWTAVEAALEQEMPVLSQKLGDYSVTPPAVVWRKIESGLQKKKEPARIILFRNKLTRIAAAAVILFAVFLGVRLFTPTAETNVITAVPELPGAAQPLQSGEEEKPAVENNDSPMVKRSAEKKERVVARTADKTSRAKRYEKKPVAVKTFRYTTMSNEEGETVRLSKKVAPVFNCAEAKIKTLSYYCRENIKLMQEKIGSSISPSTDFAGLIDLIKTLEDNQQP
jgi:negative regulator of sigma E activity